MFMHWYACVYTHTYKYKHIFIFHKPLLFSHQASFWFTIFFIVFHTDILSAVSVQKNVALASTSKAYHCSPNFSVYKVASAYQILINDGHWSHFLNFYRFFLIYPLSVSAYDFSYEKCHPINLDCVYFS